MDIESFISRWTTATGTEKSNYQLFVTELCSFLAVPTPDPAREDTRENGYVFERSVTFEYGDGTTSKGYIDCYRRGSFVLEAKKVRAASHTRGFDDALMRARNQAEQYARALPGSEGRPPFLVIVDVGNVIELYSEFTRTGGTYVPYPDPRSHRIRLDDLRISGLCDRLRKIWTEPQSLDPARITAQVTEAVAVKLAAVATSLEQTGYSSADVSAFLTRCLFSMFAEDVGLFPLVDGIRPFTLLLERHAGQPQVLAQMMESLWRDMDRGGFSAVVANTLLRFNGKLFKDAAALTLTRQQIDDLSDAAKANWRDVEPAIFGTLLERALDPKERHGLGAHYTPRAYVERLVLPTVIEPLRTEWRSVQAAAAVFAHDDKLGDAEALLRAFQKRLCDVKVLDPACGSGNFLYVTLEHLKRLEGEILNQLADLGVTGRLETAGLTVDPHQLLGLEISARAAAIAELVLWIGYLQWHVRTRGAGLPPEPVLRDFHNIENRDALIDYDGIEPELNEMGAPVTHWDGTHYTRHPVTAELVPDEGFQVPAWRYVNPRQASWPAADFVIGNPPFMGSKLMRTALGDGYVDALQASFPEVPESSDYVMRWWVKAATLARARKIRRFGLITTNSLRQVYVRRAIEPFFEGDPSLFLAFACADHPWVDSANGASVRISLTVAEAGRQDGELMVVMRERESCADANSDLVEVSELRRGTINPDLTLGVDITRTFPLRSNLGICSVGMKTIGSAFQVPRAAAIQLGLSSRADAASHIRPYISGRDVATSARELFVLDFYGLELSEVLEGFPEAYQHLLLRAKPERDQNRNRIFREKWWLIGHPRPQFRSATKGLTRYLATIETSKHRFTVFLPCEVVPDSTLVTFALSDDFSFGILSSRVHVLWALRAGGRLGVGNDPRYNKTRCFETFPFPTVSPGSSKRISHAARSIDEFRRSQLSMNAELSLTELYNTLESFRLKRPLDTVEQEVFASALIGVFAELHDELDRAVLEAYGWSDLAVDLVGKPGGTIPSVGPTPTQDAAEQDLLGRLVRLNSARFQQEQTGDVEWLRPEYQNANAAPKSTVQMRLEGTGQLPIEPANDLGGPRPFAADDETRNDSRDAKLKVEWPKDLAEQVTLVGTTLKSFQRPVSEAELAAGFRGRGAWRSRLRQIVTTLEAIGQIRIAGNGDTRILQNV